MRRTGIDTRAEKPRWAVCPTYLYRWCGICLNQLGPPTGSCSPHYTVMGGKMTWKLSKGGVLPSMNFHRPRKGRAAVAVGTHVFIDLSFIERENGSQPGHLHDLINNRPTHPSTHLLSAFLPI